jgi:hypothetical protein
LSFSACARDMFVASTAEPYRDIRARQIRARNLDVYKQTILALAVGDVEAVGIINTQKSPNG